jgi:hypothetical protein
MFHQKLWSNLLTVFSSQVLESTVFPTQMDLFLQWEVSAGQPMSNYAVSCQALLFQVVDFVGQSCNMGEFEWGRLFTPSPLEPRESANKGREAWFMVLTIEPCPVPSPERSLHGKIEKADARACLKTHTSNDLLISNARLIFEKKNLEQGKVRENSKKSFTEMDKYDNLKNGIRI